MMGCAEAHRRKPMEPLKVVVDRAKWYRGKTATDSYLLSPANQKMCCLGFASLAAGNTDKEIFGKRRLFEVVRPFLADHCVSFNPEGVSVILGQMMNLNDVPNGTNARFIAAEETSNLTSLTPEQREATLIALGKKIGLDMSFTGDK
jgi:hypothetical protein